MSDKYAKLETAKSWGIGSMSTNTNDKGEKYRTIRLNDDIEIFVGGKKLNLKRNAKGVASVNLYKLVAEKKHAKLIEAEQQYGFEVTHDLSARLDQGE